MKFIIKNEGDYRFSVTTSQGECLPVLIKVEKIPWVLYNWLENIDPRNAFIDDIPVVLDSIEVTYKPLDKFASV